MKIHIDYDSEEFLLRRQKATDLSRWLSGVGATKKPPTSVGGASLEAKGEQILKKEIVGPVQIWYIDSASPPNFRLGASQKHFYEAQTQKYLSKGELILL